MDIAPKFSATEWKALDLSSSEEDWQKAVNVFEQRISARYIEPVDLLLTAENDLPYKDRRFGFTVLSIDCLLIETIQSFKEGLVNTKGKSKEVFTRFLKESDRFKDYFSTEDHRDKFYYEFRCGILHQAEVQSSALVYSAGELYTRDNGRETVNRNAVHRALVYEFREYLDKLRAPESIELREKFKTKMDSVANRE